MAGQCFEIIAALVTGAPSAPFTEPESGFLVEGSNRGGWEHSQRVKVSIRPEFLNDGQVPSQILSHDKIRGIDRAIPDCHFRARPVVSSVRIARSCPSWSQHRAAHWGIAPDETRRAPPEPAPPRDRAPGRRCAEAGPSESRHDSFDRTRSRLWFSASGDQSGLEAVNRFTGRHAQQSFAVWR